MEEGILVLQVVRFLTDEESETAVKLPAQRQGFSKT